MAENADNDTKKPNLANLSKIPATEFEKHFHEWMERDDVARGLQAKLRCDLIKNFNKTNLGKQIMAHTMSSTGGSTYRLTLTPLVLALNTLVAEFLYAQNCHFTLSVFCTEIPFRNTLPDFESMRNYRFSEREINDIWEAVTGAATSKRYLDATILEEYEANASNSLLLLFLKSLVDMKPPEMLRKSVEIQTESNAADREKRSTAAVQTTPQSPAKSAAKGPDNLRHINKYLLILSQKVNEMTHEFEQLVKQRNLPKPQQRAELKTARYRELHTLNRSLDRINENVKQLTKSKRKCKRLTNIVESIDGLTKQFGKCAESFGEVTKELTKKERKQQVESLEPMTAPPPKVNFKEKQTETDGAQEKTYADWIYEMRTTDNGKKFLERVENSLSKAVAKHKEQWQNETDAKMKQMKSLIKLRYKQKMLMQLSRQGSEEHAHEARKLNENIELRLKQFEIKQFELMHKLRESSFELQEAQKQLHEHTEREEEEEEDKKVKECEKGQEMPKQSSQIENMNTFEYEKRTETPKTLSNENSIEAEGKSNGKYPQTKDSSQDKLKDLENTVKPSENPMPVKESANTPKTLQDLANTVTPRDHNVDRIINDAKLRLQQLETESNCLEKHFQIYLDRRKMENISRQETSHKLIAQSQSKTTEILRKFGRNVELTNIQSTKPCATEDDLDFDDEFLRLKEKLRETQLEVEMAAAGNSSSTSSSSVELKNAILDAKYKFFENEQVFRQNKEKELMQLSDRAVLQEQIEGTNSLHYSYGTKSNLDISQSKEKEHIIGFNVSKQEMSLDVESRSRNEPLVITAKGRNSSEANKKSPRRELFPKDKLNVIENVRHQEPRSSLTSRDLRQALKDLETFTQNMENKDDKSTENSEDLIKQSMAKMKQLFEESPKGEREKEKLKSFHNEFQKHRDSLETNATDIQDINLTTSTATTTSHTSHTTTTAATSATSSSLDLITKKQASMLKPMPSLPAVDDIFKMQTDLHKSLSLINPISNTSMPSLLNLTSDSEDSLKESETKQHVASHDDDDNDDSDEISSEQEISMPPQGITIPKLLITPNKADSLEIGEILSETPQSKFAPMTDMTSSESSQRTDSEFNISLGRDDRKMLAAKTSDESESDFWA